ncbi:hypothetical protein GGX14DRAFT_575374 [Mycena pura]|uniref:Uncharacterized protein n=1 Tax=Mycena pura TaxID=153505 RepID=A0AAD6Y626_9AGAR|nr:hypothetical protein GGX14DRAFT_575374 [Mycena pura]
MHHSSPHKAPSPRDHDQPPVGRCCPCSTRRSTLSDIGLCLASLIRRCAADSGDSDGEAEPRQPIWHKSTGTQPSTQDDILAVAHGARLPSRRCARRIAPASSGSLPRGGAPYAHPAHHLRRPRRLDGPVDVLPPFPNLKAKLPSSSTTTTMSSFSGDAFPERMKAAAAQRDSYTTPAHTARKRMRHECDSLTSAAPCANGRDEIPTNSLPHSIHLALPLVTLRLL